MNGLAKTATRLSNSFLRFLVTLLGSWEPGRILYTLIDRFYRSTPPRSDVQPVFSLLTSRMNRINFSEEKGKKSAQVLVFLLRGPFYNLNLYNYAVGCALRHLGYRVHFVMCSGSVEHCGFDQEGSSAGPPFACGLCREIVKAASLEGFHLVNLNDYVTSEEEEQVRVVSELSNEELFSYSFKGVPLFETIKPSLMRFYRGDIRKMASSNGTLRSHLKASVRFLGRYGNLLDEIKPDCLCFFNGLFFPESLCGRDALARGIPVLFTEIGPRKGTIFVSINEPACHYQSDRLWNEKKGKTTESDIQSAMNYLNHRMTYAEDPLGIRRKIIDTDREKYRQLARSPYVIFFSPVTHDTASMGNGNSIVEFFEILKRLSILATQGRKRLIIRAHPDELIKRNPSYYPVEKYLRDQNLLQDEFVLCLNSEQKWNPYLLAEHADAIVIYKGTLGIELPSLGYEVFNLTPSHYSHKGFTLDVTLEDLARVFVEKKQPLPPEIQKLALKYLYFYFFEACIPFDSFLKEGDSPSLSLLRGDEDSGHKQLEHLEERIAFLLDSNHQELTPKREKVPR